MHTALINCHEEKAKNDSFATLAIELAKHDSCSGFYTTSDQLIILEFCRHNTGLFCVFGEKEIEMIWNTPTKFFNISIKKDSVTHEQLKEKIHNILK